MTQLVATGEHDVIVDGYVHNAVALKEKGAPIDYVVMNPTIVRPPSIIAILARAPHPYASALFLDYHLSKEASEIMVKSQGRWAPRKDVPWTVEPQGDLHVVPALQWGPKMRKLCVGSCCERRSHSRIRVRNDIYYLTFDGVTRG